MPLCFVDRKSKNDKEKSLRRVYRKTILNLIKIQACDELIRIIGLSQTFEYPVIKTNEEVTGKMKNTNDELRIPLWVKPNLSIEEAASYFGIGMGKLYEMTSREDCPFVLWVGSRRMIKRKSFEEYLDKAYSL